MIFSFRLVALLIVLSFCGFAQTTNIIQISTGFNCSVDLQTNVQVNINCKIGEQAAFNSSTLLTSLVARTSGFVIGLTLDTTNNIIFVLKRQSATDPLTVNWSVNNGPQQTKTVPVP